MSSEKPEPGVDRRVFLKAAAAAAGATVAAGPLATAANAQETKASGTEGASTKTAAREIGAAIEKFPTPGVVTIEALSKELKEGSKWTFERVPRKK